MLEKRRIGLSALIVIGLYVVIGWFIWTINATTWVPDRVGYYLPSIMLRGYCPTFFLFLTICSVFFVTPVLQRKFAKPQTATAYLTLPGTTVEKYWVMLAEYLLGFVVCGVLYALCFYATALLGSLLDHPVTLVASWEGSERPLNAYGWFDFSPFYFDSIANAYDTISEFLTTKSTGDAEHDAVIALARTVIYMIPCISLLELGYYLVLNMLFHTYGQIKSILCYLGTQMCLNMVATFVIIATVGYCSSLEQREIDEFMISCLHALTGLTWVMPILMVGMYYLLYRLMQRKQAK